MADEVKRNIFALGAVSFFTDFSTEMIMGLLPLFITGDLGASRAFLGLMEGLGELFGYSTRSISGAISDKIGKRKLLVIIGYGISSISKPMFAFAGSAYQAIAIRMTDRLGKGIRNAPRDALLSESVTDGELGKAFGLHKSLDQAGAIFGPIVAFALLPIIGIRTVFLFSIFPGIISIIILIAFVKEPKVAKANVSMMKGFREVLGGKFLLYLFSLLIFSIGAFNFSFIILYARDAGIPLASIPLVYALINISHTLAGYPSGMLADKIGGIKVLLACFVLFAVVSISGAFAPVTQSTALFIAIIFGGYVGISETVQRAMIPKLVPEELKATAYGAYYLFMGISLLVANVAFGTIWDVFGREWAFFYSAITSTLGFIALLVFSRN